MLNDRTRIGWARNSMLLLPNPSPPKTRERWTALLLPHNPVRHTRY